MTVNVTQQVAAFAHALRWEDLSPKVCHEAKRSILNCIATAVAGSGESPVDKSIAVIGPYSSDGNCTLIGRSETVNAPFAAYINAMSANIFDYDDTHQNTVIHPTAPVAPALFAWAQDARCSGMDLIAAFIVGAEIECRIGNAVSPSHYARGWHITSTCGIFGAAVGVGRLIGLNVDQQIAALANASAQAAGMVETLGTMSKSISVGNAARNGMLSALLAQDGYTGPPDPLTGERGFLTVFSDTPNSSELVDELGERWEIATNTYKPYPTGIVLHPVIDACIDLYNEQGLRSEDIVRVELAGHPLLQQRADRPDVTTGRLSQVSVQHAIAIAFRRGRAGLGEFTDDAVLETLNDGIRPDVMFTDVDDCAVESVFMSVTCRDGRQFNVDVSCAQGGPGNPMSDADIERKLVDLCRYRGVALDCTRISDAIWTLDETDDAASVMQLLSV